MVVANLKGQDMMTKADFNKTMLALFQNRIRLATLLDIIFESYSLQIEQHGIIYSQCPHITEIFDSKELIDLY